jgi:hypothetical protein
MILGGDSIANSLAPLFLTNNAVSGSQAVEVSNAVLSWSGDEYNLMFGTNDVRIYKDNATKKGYFKAYLTHVLAWLALPSKLTARNMVATGTWNNTSANSIGRYSTVNGSTLSGVVTGCKLYVGYIIQNSSLAVSTADVYVDSVLVGSISCDGYTVAMNTQNGASYGHSCAVFDVPYGTHTVEIINTSANGKYLYVNYIANEQVENKIKISNIIKLSSSVYTSLGISSATTDAYNAIIDDVLCHFDCTLIDNHADIDPAIHLTDGVHLDSVGKSIAYDNFKQG